MVELASRTESHDDRETEKVVDCLQNFLSAAAIAIAYRTTISTATGPHNRNSEVRQSGVKLSLQRYQASAALITPPLKCGPMPRKRGDQPTVAPLDKAIAINMERRCDPTGGRWVAPSPLTLGWPVHAIEIWALPLREAAKLRWVSPSRLFSYCQGKGNKKTGNTNKPPFTLLLLHHTSNTTSPAVLFCFVSVLCHCIAVTLQRPDPTTYTYIPLSIPPSSFATSPQWLPFLLRAPRRLALPICPTSVTRLSQREELHLRSWCVHMCPARQTCDSCRGRPIGPPPPVVRRRRATPFNI